MSVWSEVVPKPLEPVRPLPFADASIWGSAFKSASYPGLIDSEWMLPNLCAQVSGFPGMSMIPGRPFLSVPFPYSFF